VVESCILLPADTLYVTRLSWFTCEGIQCFDNHLRATGQVAIWGDAGDYTLWGPERMSHVTRESVMGPMNPSCDT